jgi:hypothetical protein
MCELAHTRRILGCPNGGLPATPDTFTNTHLTRPIIFGGRATYVDCILKAAKPSELPVQVKFELVIISRRLRLSADCAAHAAYTHDEVIE